jgi:hypothetical protein
MATDVLSEFTHPYDIRSVLRVACLLHCLKLPNLFVVFREQVMKDARPKPYVKWVLPLHARKRA